MNTLTKIYPLSTTTNGYPVINLNASVPNILGISGISLQVGNADENVHTYKHRC